MRFTYSPRKVRYSLCRKGRRRLILPMQSIPTLGNRCIAAKINYELMPRTVLRNGDRVEIITASTSKPNLTGCTLSQTGKARSHIRHFLKTMRYEESVALGERLLNQSLAALKLTEPVDEALWERFLREEAGERTLAGSIV